MFSDVAVSDINRSSTENTGSRSIFHSVGSLSIFILRISLFLSVRPSSNTSSAIILHRWPFGECPATRRDLQMISRWGHIFNWTLLYPTAFFPVHLSLSGVAIFASVVINKRRILQKMSSEFEFLQCSRDGFCPSPTTDIAACEKPVQFLRWHVEVGLSACPHVFEFSLNPASFTALVKQKKREIPRDTMLDISCLDSSVHRICVYEYSSRNYKSSWRWLK